MVILLKNAVANGKLAANLAAAGVPVTISAITARSATAIVPVARVAEDTARSPPPPPQLEEGDKKKSNLALGLGVGLGVGIPVILVIVAVLMVQARRKQSVIYLGASSGRSNEA